MVSGLWFWICPINTRQRTTKEKKRRDNKKTKSICIWELNLPQSNFWWNHFFAALGFWANKSEEAIEKNKFIYRDGEKKRLLDWTTFNSISLKRFHFDCLHYFICLWKYLCEWTLFAASHKDSIFLWMRPLDVPNIFVIKNQISATLNLISFCKFTHFNAFYFGTVK